MIIVIVIAGMLLILPLILFMTLFAENILFLDSLLISVIGTVLIHSAIKMHPVFCILTALAILAGMTCLYVREQMFWIFTMFSTLFWGYVSGFVMQDIIGDRIWGTFIGLIVGAMAFALHLYARNQMTQQI